METVKRGKLTLQGRDGETSAMVDMHVHGEEAERVLMDLLAANEEVFEEWDLTEPAVQLVDQ